MKGMDYFHDKKSIPREGAYIEFLVENSIFISTSASEIV